MSQIVRRLMVGAAFLLLASCVMAAPLKHSSHMKPRVVKPALGDGEAFTFVAYGDTRSNRVAHAAVVKEIVSLHPEFVLQSGDLVSDGGNPRQWEEFDQIEKPIQDAHIAYYPARGNHDLGRLYSAHVTQPFDSGDTVNKLYYAFTRHHNRFIAVDSMQAYDPDSDQYKWLETELAKARKNCVNTFVFFHESPFSVGPHGPTPAAQQYLHPLFVKYKPRLVICGHDHLYYRTLRDGVPYVVTGGGGAPLYDPVNKQIALPGDVYVKSFHAIRLVVDGTRVAGTVFTPEGAVIDRFTLGPK